jgi:hypothetical protein
MPRPIILRTVRDYVTSGYSAWSWCEQCGFVDVSLVRLVMKGKGDKPLRKIRLRHACGKELELRIRPPEMKKDGPPGRVL